jgi:hypothetical protein
MCGLSRAWKNSIDDCSRKETSRDMPQGYYTIEQWKQPAEGAPPQWIAIRELPFGATLTAAEEALDKLGAPGFYRIVHLQRVIWAERTDGGLKLRKSHAASTANLDEMRAMFEQCGGRYPLEEVRAARRAAKARRRRS